MSGTAMQLTLEGKEVPHEQVVLRPRLGPAQKRFLRVLSQNPGMTSTEANTISPGGARAIRRLARRGLVVKHFGLWFVAKEDWE